MKHVLRIGIVLVICVGLGFLISYFVNSKKPYNVFDDYVRVQASLKTLDDSTEGLTISGSSANKFFELNSLYEFYKTSFNMNLKNVKLLKLETSQINELKNLKKELNKNLVKVTNDVKSISNYLNETSPNAEYLDGLINNANQSFILLNQSFNSICLKFQNLINEKIYNNNSYILSDTLNLNLLYMSSAYLNLNTEYGYNDFNIAFNKFKNYLSEMQQTSNSATTFMINFYSLEENHISLYEYYFKNRTTDNVKFEKIIQFITEGDY